MFLRILKKDLKRKKTMNIILMLFVILCSMFAAAAANNIIAVTGGIEHYFDAADVPDVTVRTVWENDIEEKIAELDCVEEIKTEHWLHVLSSKKFRHNGKKLDNFTNVVCLISDSEMAINYFDENNNVIESVDEGCFYATSQFLQNSDIEEGDEVELDVGEVHLTLRFMGRFKGALFPSGSSNSPYLILNSADYNRLSEDKASHILNYKLLYINTSSVDEIEEIAENYGGVYITTREESKSIYLYDMIGAYIMLVISIVLMITAFTVLRFTIGFTIGEEFREIGVMKAVGIGSGSIRGIYIVKYFAVAVIGAAIGFFCSIPLNDMMMKSVSENMVLGAESGIIMGLLSSAAVVVIILLFCYGCTRRIKKLSPIDAVRNGQTGERFGRKSFLHLGRSKLPSAGFMAVNDVLSAPNQFGIITVIFTLCILLMTIMSTFALTLKSEKILRFFDVPSSEAHIMDSEIMGDVVVDQSTYKRMIADTEKLLADNGMPGKCTMTLGTQLETSYKDKTAKIIFNVTKGETDDTLYTDEGSAPQKLDEIAVTSSTLKDLNAEIGDRVTAVIDGEEREFIITGTYSSFGGRAAFMYKDFDFGDLPASNVWGIQIHFVGSPDKAQINENIKKLRDLLDTDKVYSSSDYIKNFTGISDTLNAIKQMMMILTVIVTAFIVVLMECSFISKEKSEIALMKAVGIPNGCIVAQHTLRFVIVSVLACIISLAALMPISNVLMNWICGMVGDISGIKCDIDPVEIFIICPAILIGVTVIGSFLTAFYTKTIKASDTASIE